MTPAQCRMARAALQWTVKELSEASDVSTATITRFEKGVFELRAGNGRKVQAALEAAGVEFTDDGRVCVRLKGDDG